MGLEEVILTHLMEGDGPEEIAGSLGLESDILENYFESLWDSGMLCCQLLDF